ncbi:right-handed parallel beta-helix repeat-containing protein [Corallococcus exiguus]|uniref:Right handed beta helix domain-containing protein n=1 Tax=Corallococcus exiguus TaxID=83462 RepID=A0A7X4YB15_9BACT|nr:right-handed parallel beta-helix repeat-containing protein [Corallococcus exiguus]NBC41374.1 hypothetical protein [Corallococcus exiguus]
MMGVAGGGIIAPVQAGVVSSDEVTVYVNSAAPMAGTREARIRDGLTPERAVASIAAAEKILMDRGVLKARVLLRGGTYYPCSPIHWTYSPPGGHITFGTEPGTGDVIIDGSRLESSGTEAAVAMRSAVDEASIETMAAGYGMTLDSSDSSVVVDGYTFQYFRNGGVRISGQPGDRTSNIVIRNNTFQYIGEKYNKAGSGTGYGGVHVTNSSGTRIEGNRFYYLVNDDSPGSIHGVYLANYSNSSVIRNNRFGYISGDPIRTRHNSKNNIVDSNKFWQAGAYAIFSDWRFDNEDCGSGNVFKNNQVGYWSYNGDKWNEGAQGGIDPVRVRLWGHDQATNANLGGCSTDPITFSGDNSYVSSRPW